MKLDLFLTKDLKTASLDLFNQLGVPFKEGKITEQPNKLEKVLTEQYFIPLKKYGLDNTKAIFVGLIDDAVLNRNNYGGGTLQFDDEQDKTEKEVEKIIKERKDYKGLMVWAVELETENPSRTQLADITRAFNRRSNNMPVVVICKYKNNEGAFISLSTNDEEHLL